MALLEVQQLLFQRSKLDLLISNGQFDLSQNPPQSSQIRFHNHTQVHFSLIPATAKEKKEYFISYNPEDEATNTENGIYCMILLKIKKKTAI